MIGVNPASDEAAISDLGAERSRTEGYSDYEAVLFDRSDGCFRRAVFNGEGSIAAGEAALDV